MKARDWTRSLPASLVRCAFQDGLLVPAVRAYCRPLLAVQAIGQDHIEGPLLIVANHASHLDAPAVLAALPPHLRHRTAVAAAADYFYRSPVIGAAASLGMGAFAFARHGRDGCARAATLLADGWNVVLFPQGSRGAVGAWQPFRAGVGHLVAETGVAVLPLAVVGTATLWPRGQRFPRRGNVEIRFGKVWRPEPNMSPTAIVVELERCVLALASLTANC